VIDEKTIAFHGEINGVLHRGDQKLKYNIGARWIRTLQTLTGYNNVTDTRNVLQSLGDGARYPNYIVPVTMKGSYSAFLPSMNVVWEVMEDFQIRGAVSRTMTRANPATMLPQLSGSGSGADQWTLGNPDLRPYYSTNIDLGAELFTGGEGYVGVGLFKKMITGFPSNFTTTQNFPWLAPFGYSLALYASNTTQYINIMNKATTGGCWDASLGQANTAPCASIFVTQARNAQGLESIKGVELNWVQPLDFYLDQFGLKGFGWVANATMISTKTTPGSAAPSVVLNVSPLTYNLTGYYDNDGIMLKVSYAYQRGTITNSNVYGVWWGFPYVTEQRSLDYAQVDLSSSIKLSKFVGDLPSDPEVTFDVQNLTHAKVGRSYTQYKNLMNYSYNAGSMFMIGVRGSF
jgi:TonB-dependent receptor